MSEAGKTTLTISETTYVEGTTAYLETNKFPDGWLKYPHNVIFYALAGLWIAAAVYASIV